MLGDARTAVDSERGGMADGSARVPEVLAPAELDPSEEALQRATFIFADSRFPVVF